MLAPEKSERLDFEGLVPGWERDGDSSITM